MSEVWVLSGLGAVMGLVLILPFAVRWVEEELEAFLLVMGIASVTLSGIWSRHVIAEALVEPVKISAAVLVFGLLFRRFRDSLRRRVSAVAARMGLKLFLFSVVVGLGLLSSVITAIIAALVLVEIISGLQLDRSHERAIVILTCYSIGLGAVLTPLGEPLSTIATAKLSGPPHAADFFFLARLLWAWVLGAILLLGLLVLRLGPGQPTSAAGLMEDAPEEIRTILTRAAKVYVFVAAVVLLGHGFSPIVDRYLVQMPSSALYWLNMVSAVLDNATLAAAEISPRMDADRIRFLLMGLLISGGMMIPGNIPNIICAGKLGIRSGEWAKFGIPVGLAFMTVCFIGLRIAGF